MSILKTALFGESCWCPGAHWHGIFQAFLALQRDSREAFLVPYFPTGLGSVEASREQCEVLHRGAKTYSASGEFARALHGEGNSRARLAALLLTSRFSHTRQLVRSRRMEIARGQPRSQAQGFLGTRTRKGMWGSVQSSPLARKWGGWKNQSGLK